MLADQFGFGEAKLESLRKVLATLVAIDVNHESVLDAYVAVARACRTAPGGARTLSNNDLWIAATAAASKAVLLTADKDFLCTPGSARCIWWIRDRQTCPTTNNSRPSGENNLNVHHERGRCLDLLPWTARMGRSSPDSLSCASALPSANHVAGPTPAPPRGRPTDLLRTFRLIRMAANPQP